MINRRKGRSLLTGNGIPSSCARYHIRGSQQRKWKSQERWQDVRSESGSVASLVASGSDVVECRGEIRRVDLS